MFKQTKVLLSLLVIISILLGCTPAAPVPPQSTATDARIDAATMTPTEIPATVEPTKTPTATPEPTATPTPLPTPSPADVLAENSFKFVAEWEDKADEVARAIGYIDGVNESAANVCGPLSITQLRDAGWLPQSTDPHDAWLLCARDGEGDCVGIQTLKDNYFPPEYYDYTRVTTSVRDYDWVNNPLKPGDWLYLYIIYRGFDHMITVTRVDDAGRAYSVTNINRGMGFEIHEELLYDPADPTTGIFQELTYFPTRRKLGMTGTGGFLLVRRKDGTEGFPSITGLDAALSPDYRWNALVESADKNTVVYESLPNEVFKYEGLPVFPIVMTALKAAEGKGVTAADLTTVNFQGQTLDALIQAGISGDATALTILREYTEDIGSERAILDGWGLRNTYLDQPMTSSRELATLISGLQLHTFLKEDLADYLAGKLSEGAQSTVDKLPFCQKAEVCWVTDFAVTFDDPNLKTPPPGITGMARVNGTDYAFVLIANPNRTVPEPQVDIKASLETFWQAWEEGSSN